MLYEKDDDYKRHVHNYENSRKNLELEMKKQQEDLEIFREKAMKFDELNREYKKIEQEKYLLEEKVGFIINENKPGSERAEIYKQQDDFRRKFGIIILNYY